MSEGGTDCGGLSALFVSVMRASDIPARMLVGRWAESGKEGDKVGGVTYYQEHVKAEFHADGVGWIPVDMASAVSYDQSKEGLRYFGQDEGDFLVLHIDADLRIDMRLFGRQDVGWLQGAALWVKGAGKFDDEKLSETWKVRVVKE